MNRTDDVRQSVTEAAPVVWITGAGRPRLGQHLARDWAAVGARLILHAHQSRRGAEALADELAAGGERPLVVVGDLSDAGEVGRMLDLAIAHFGRVDHLIHTASTWLRRPLEDLTAAETLSEWQNNLAAPFWLCQQVGLQMVGQPHGGSIVLIGDWSCDHPHRDYAAYFVSKGALPTLVRVFAVELSQRNPLVRVNGLLPGPLVLPGDRDAADRPLDPAANLIGRGVGAVEIAAAARLLATNRAFQGTMLPVHGGRDLV